MRSGLLFLTFVVSLLSSSVLAQSRIDCARVDSTILKRQIPYCVILPSAYGTDLNRKFPVLYYLHGLGENEQAITGPFWNVVERMQETHEIGDFLIATPAARQTFYINSKDGRQRYEDFLVREFFPHIEKKYRIASDRAHRGISGTSMGGYGALRLAFKHPELFAAVSAHMAALYPKVPQEFLDYAELNGGGRLATVFGSPFDETFWERNTPFYFARLNAARIRTLKLKVYFDCGDKDDYSFDLGAKQLDRQLTHEKIPHEFHIYPGRHDPMFVAQHLADSLGFQSKALEQSTATQHATASK
jgi:S-formylglutathione hydrolase FrmB